MPVYTVLKQPLRHNAKDYDPGAVVDVDAIHAEPLLAAGLLAPAPHVALHDGDVIILADIPPAEKAPVVAVPRKPAPKKQPPRH